eukprot:11730880-Ditylum_brightwellii.AAC.1
MFRIRDICNEAIQVVKTVTREMDRYESDTWELDNMVLLDADMQPIPLGGVPGGNIPQATRDACHWLQMSL